MTSLEKELELKNRVISRLDTNIINLGKEIDDLHGQVDFLDGQLLLAVGQKSISEIGNDIQDAVTQQALGGANQVNQDMAKELVTAHQKIRELEGILEKAGINPNGNNH